MYIYIYICIHTYKTLLVLLCNIYIHHIYCTKTPKTLRFFACMYTCITHTHTHTRTHISCICSRQQHIVQTKTNPKPQTNPKPKPQTNPKPKALK